MLAALWLSAIVTAAISATQRMPSAAGFGIGVLSTRRRPGSVGGGGGLDDCDLDEPAAPPRIARNVGRLGSIASR